MKTIYRYIISFAALLLWAGCVEVEIAEELSVEITARMETEPDSKTILSGLENGMYYALWEAGDEIAVYVDGDADPSKFCLKSGDGSTVASFTGTRKGEDHLALYPYDIAGSVSGGSFSVTLPATQKYVKDSFGPGAFPMVAKGTAEDGLHFMNLCSVLKITLTGTAAVRSVTLTANDEDTFMSGPATVVTEYTASTENYLTMSAEGSRSVVLETKGLEISEDAPADVFIVIPSQTYKGGFTIEVDTYTEKVTKTVSSDITFERSQIRAITNLELDSEIPDIIPETIPDNEIWYVTNDASKAIGVVVGGGKWNIEGYGAEIIEHVYEDGLGIIRFDGPVTKINDYIISDYLVKVILPDKIENIDSNPFISCPNLTEFGGKLASEDGRYLVLDGVLIAAVRSGIEEFIVPDGITSIGSQAFANNECLRKIVIPEGVERLERKAFFRNSALEEVYLPSTINSMGEYNFTMCKKIKKFYGSSKLISEDGYSIIVDDYKGGGMKFLLAFASGAGLTSYVIPEGVGGLEQYSMSYAEELRELTFPKTLTIVASAALNYTYNIERIYGPNVLEDNRSLVYDNTLLYVAPKGLTDYSTPKGVTNLSQGVLADKPELVNVVISDDVTTVEGKIVGNYSVSPYGYILVDCPRLKTVTISARMTWLGFDPWGWEYNVKNETLSEVYLRSPIPPMIKHNYPEQIPAKFPNLKIFIPEETSSLYMSSPYWIPYRDYFEPYDYGDLGEFYSQDGVVKTLQSATKGDGIDVVFMGDAYSDRQIADGTYEADMVYMYDNLFTQEPFKTHKDMFNVYYVNVVSATEGYDNSGSALGGYFGEGTLVGGNDNKCFEYALNAITEDEMDEALIIVAMNSDAYAGTCYMYWPESTTGTYGSGPAVAYFPKGGDQTTFAQLLHHEANGHGFAKLADEYAYEDMGAVPSDYVTEILDQQNNWGWWKNVDFTDDPKQVRWANFLEDERYANEGLGLFEGGLTYWTGVWRPTETSIMVNNAGEFNAPSREAIYYRIHKLAYGDSWEYDYEKFVEYDAVNRTSASADAPQKRRANYVEKSYEPLAPPVIVGKTWKEAQK